MKAFNNLSIVLLQVAIRSRAYMELGLLAHEHYDESNQHLGTQDYQQFYEGIFAQTSPASLTLDNSLDSQTTPVISGYSSQSINQEDIPRRLSNNLQDTSAYHWAPSDHDNQLQTNAAQFGGTDNMAVHIPQTSIRNEHLHYATNPADQTTSEWPNALRVRSQQGGDHFPGSATRENDLAVFIPVFDGGRSTHGQDNLLQTQHTQSGRRTDNSVTHSPGNSIGNEQSALSTNMKARTRKTKKQPGANARKISTKKRKKNSKKKKVPTATLR